MAPPNEAEPGTRPAKKPPLWPDRIAAYLSDREGVAAHFVAVGNRVAFYPRFRLLNPFSGRWVGARPGVWLEPAEAGQVRRLLLTAHVLANTVLIPAAALFSVALLVLLAARDGMGPVLPFQGLFLVGILLQFAVREILPHALAAGHPPCPPRKELEPEPA